MVLIYSPEGSTPRSPGQMSVRSGGLTDQRLSKIGALKADLNQTQSF